MAKIHVLVYNRPMKKIEGIHKYVWIEFAIWFLVLCFVIAGVRIYRYHKNKELVTYQLFLPDVDGLIVGSPVKFMGVQVGYVDRIKILSNDVYIKVIITDKEVIFPKGSIATVEFNGMGGSKSLEVYPPTEESLASNKLLVIKNPKRLHDSLGLLNDMFDKLGSITNKLSFFARETGLENMDTAGLEIQGIETNMNMLDKWMNGFSKNKNKGVTIDEQRQSENNQ